MRFIAFSTGNGPALGLVTGDEVANLTAQGLPATLEDLLRAGPEGMAAAKAAAAKASRAPLSQITYLAPLQSPGKAIAVGLNYRDHAAEVKLELPTYPLLFNRFPSSWVAHQAPIICPRVSDKYDYEGELAVIIGKAGRHISVADALDHVAGYSVFNEGSVRDYQRKSPQWMMGKNFDQSGSFGPVFVTADELPAGGKGLRLTTRLNGQVMQDAKTDNMIFDVATLISVCSEVFALMPGDVIISGTPAGVGVARDPKVFMKAGDVCEVEIEGIGLLSNPIHAEA